jgi:CHC2 zinc finger
MSASSKVLERLACVKQVGAGKWMALCPAHEDRSPSLSVRDTDNGRVLVYCFAGCGAGDVLNSIGLRLSDLFDGPIAHHLPAVRQQADANETLVAIAHEVTVVNLIAHDLRLSEKIGDTQRSRLLLAEQRLNRAMSLIAARESPEMRRIRRAEGPSAP